MAAVVVPIMIYFVWKKLDKQTGFSVSVYLLDEKIPDSHCNTKKKSRFAGEAGDFQGLFS
jgi:hypothetical protein